MSSIFDLFLNLKDFVISLGGHSPWYVMLILFIKGGWIPVLICLIWGGWQIYVLHIQSKWYATIKWALLAIDIPKENLQSAKAVEHIFATMWPFLESKNLIEKYYYGMFQPAFSLEIVSIGGYTQFLIRVPATHKDIVEAGIYAQYPKAEITEVEDYADRYQDVTFPSDEYDLWGTEFKLAKPSPYPIRTYPSFEHTLSQTFADPMAQLLETFSKANPGEEMWLQFVITPIKDDWKAGGYKIINQIIGAKQPAKKYWFDQLFWPFHYLATLIQELFTYGIGYEPGKIGAGETAKPGNEPPNKMLYLTPEEKNIIEGITAKMSKIAYQTKCRIIYLGKKGQLVKPKGAANMIGALQQFSAIDMNSFVPIMKTMTKANYFFVKKRVIGKQNRILRNFRGRAQTGGWGAGFVLNIEELASLFHFPVPEVALRGVKQVTTKKESPPADLPDTIFAEEQARVDQIKAAAVEATKGEPPADLPI